jgi:hypothetical protein
MIPRESDSAHALTPSPRSSPAGRQPIRLSVDRHVRLGLLLLGWALVHAGRDGVWEPLGDFGAPVTCERVRESSVAADVLRDIGSALAGLPADNPIRQQAYERADRRIRERYRCEWRES